MSLLVGLTCFSPHVINVVTLKSMSGTLQSASVPHAMPYARACCLLQACATLLRMPPRAVATAIAYLHRWHAVVATDEGSALAEAAAAAAEEGEQAEDVMLEACLFLASKVEEAAVSNNHLVNAVRLVRHLAGQGQVQGACVGGPGLGQGQAPEQQVGVGQQHSHSHGTRDGAGGLPGDGHTAADGAQYQYSCQQQQQLPGHRPQHEHVGDEREGEDGQVPLQGQGHTQPGWRRAEQQQQQQQDEQQHQRERGRGQRSDGSGLDERHVQQRNSSEGGVGETGAGEGGGHGAAAAALPVGLLAPLALLRRRPAQLEAVRGALGGCEVLVGQGYYAAKARMMHCEQLLLRALRWQLPVPQPHGLALNAARCLRLPGGVQRLAVCLLNDLWCYTDMCLMGQGEREATTLAALEAACRACGHVVHVPSHAGEAVPGLGWWQLLGVAEGEEVFLGVRVRGVMEAVAGCHAVLGVGKAEGDHGRGEQ